MSLPEPEHPIDALVRGHLLRQADAVDAAAILARVLPDVKRARERRADPPPAPRRSRSRALWRSTALAATAAAALLLAFLFGRFAGPARASAESLVRESRDAHALPVDRCYLVQSTPEPGAPFRFPRLAQPRETRLWTRGDRFYLESVGPDRPGPLGRLARRWAWGRDEQGRVWLALPGDRGLRYDADENGDEPAAVRLACDVCSLQPATLFDEVLARFELRREDDGDPATHRIRAEPKPGAPPCPWLRSAVLEIEAESRALRRLTLHRTRAGQPLAVVTFTLVETRPVDDDLYTLEGHLNPGVKPYSASYKPLLRARLLAPLLRLPGPRPAP
jgi:hypothetical protein